MAKLGHHAIHMLNDNLFLGKIIIYMTNINTDDYGEFENLSNKITLNPSSYLG